MEEQGRVWARTVGVLRPVLLSLALACAVTDCADSESENPNGADLAGAAGATVGTGGTTTTGGATGTGGDGGGTGGTAGTDGTAGTGATGGTAGASGAGAGGQPEAGAAGVGGEATSGTAGQAGDQGSAGAAGGPIAITGVFSYAPNPCFTDPCLPGMAAYLTQGSDRYVLRVQGRMPTAEYDWGNWDGYIPQNGETITALGYVTTAQDIYGSTVTFLEVVQLSAA